MSPISYKNFKFMGTTVFEIAKGSGRIPSSFVLCVDTKRLELNMIVMLKSDVELTFLMIVSEMFQRETLFSQPFSDNTWKCSN